MALAGCQHWIHGECAGLDAAEGRSRSAGETRLSYEMQTFFVQSTIACARRRSGGLRARSESALSLYSLCVLLLLVMLRVQLPSVHQSVLR